MTDPATVAPTGPIVAAGPRPRAAQAAVVAVFFVHGFLFASWTAHIPHIKSHLGIGDATLGLALLGVPAGCVAAIGAAAFLVPRVGSRLIVQLSLIAYVLTGPLVGLAGSVAGLFVALLAWGLFQGLLDIAMNTQAIAVEGARDRALMHGFHASWSLGSFAGASAGALGVALGLTLSVQLLVLGVPVLIAAGLLTMRMLTDRIPATTVDNPKPAGPRVSGPMLVLGSIAFASFVCEGAAADWSSVYLHDSLGAGRGLAGVGFTGFAFAMLLVRFFGNRLLVRFGLRVLLPVLAVLATVVFAAALAIGQIAAAIPGLFVLGLGLGAVVPSMFSAAGRLPGIHPGVGVAGVSGMGYAGFVCGPAVIGQLAGLTSLPVALGLLPVLTAYIAVATRRARALG